MKKQLMAMAVAAALATTGAAQAAGGTYFGAQLGVADVSGFDEGMMLAATLGVPADQMVPNLAFEAELGMTVVDPDRNVIGGTAELSYWYLGGFAVYNLPLNNNLKLRGKLGLGYLDVEVDAPGGTASEDDIEAMFGVGLTVPMRGTMRFITEYTRVESDIDQISAGLQFDF